MPERSALQRVVLFTEDDPLRLACGRALGPVEVAFETYGTFDGTNAAIVCHALTGDAHAAGEDGWWSAMVGPGRPVDTDRLFVVSPNLIGGCRGSTGPSSPDPATGEAYGLRFPPLAMADLVAVHRALLAHLGVERLHTAIGGSMGGMQVLEWLLSHPGEIERAVLVGASSRLSAQNVALSVVARDAIMGDPDFRDGDYARHGVRPDRGMAVARKLGHVTYLSEAGMARRFDRREPGPQPPDAADWLATRYDVESYLDHQAAVFLARFDALTYLYLSRMMDGFEPFADPTRRVDPAARVLVLAFTSDWRFGPDHSYAVAAGLRARGAGEVEVEVLDADTGHDSFLLDVPGYQDAVAAFLSR